MPRNIKPTLLIPFDKAGHLVSAVDSYKADRYEWREVFVFDAGLAILEFDFGRTRMNVILKDVDTGFQYTMMLRDYEQAMELAEPSKAFVDGKSRLVLSWLWTFRRGGGSHYFLIPVEG